MSVQAINLMNTGAISNASPAIAKPDPKMVKLWKEYGWTSASTKEKAPFEDLSSLLVQHPDFVQFLRKSSLLYVIKGYQNTLDRSQETLDLGMKNVRDGIKLDSDGHPLLLVEGMWMRWEDLKTLVKIDPVRKKIVSIANPDLEWNYISPNGLVQKTLDNQIEHVHQLSSNEVNRLYQHSLKFFRNKEIAPPQNSCGFIQVFTAGKSRIGQIGHVGLRMIDKEGKVYSFGFETPSNEASLSETGILSALATFNVDIVGRDFKEFREFDIRRTTTIPLTEEKFHQTLEKLRNYANTNLRFNILHQNCAAFTVDILKTAGVAINIRTTSILEGIYYLLPAAETIPYIGPILKKIVSFVKAIFAIIAKYTPAPIRFLAKVITFIPSLCLTMIKNSVVLLFGAAKSAAPPREHVENNRDNSKALTAFDRVFNHWTDFFRDDAFILNLPYRVSDWQMEQGSTEIRRFSGPQFYIVPPKEQI